MKGKVFGDLTVIERTKNPADNNGNAWWLCQCSCGERVAMRGDKLRAGYKTVCKKNGHGKPEPKISSQLRRKYRSEYGSWRGMHRRCRDESHQKYLNYGGRGIKIHPRWDVFINFLMDMGPRPSPKHSIDRIDNNGHYEPGNCRWATNAEQQRNRQDTVYVKWQGKKILLLDLVGELGLSRSIVYSRLHMGWSLAAALAIPNLKKIGFSTKVLGKVPPGKRRLRGRLPFCQLPYAERIAQFKAKYEAEPALGLVSRKRETKKRKSRTPALFRNLPVPQQVVILLRSIEKDCGTLDVKATPLYIRKRLLASDKIFEEVKRLTAEGHWPPPDQPANNPLASGDDEV